MFENGSKNLKLIHSLVDNTKPGSLGLKVGLKFCTRVSYITLAHAYISEKVLEDLPHESLK